MRVASRFSQDLPPIQAAARPLVGLLSWDTVPFQPIGAHREKIKTKLGLETASELEREALLYVERGG